MDRFEREKEALYQLELCGINEVTDSFYTFDNDADTYFEAESERDYFMLYCFETLPQLRERLADVWKDEVYMQDILKTLLSAAMKSKPLEKSAIVRRDVEQTIPVYIYNF